MQSKYIKGFWLLFNFIHMYLISGNTTINKSTVDVQLGGEVIIKKYSFLEFYVGPDCAPIFMAALSIFGIVLFNNAFRKEKNTLVSNIELFLVMLLINLIMVRLRVNIIY